jgi:hypothetical protein
LFFSISVNKPIQKNRKKDLVIVIVHCLRIEKSEKVEGAKQKN